MIICVANGKGGVGKTTTALNLAIDMNADCVFDIDSRNSIFKMLALRGKELKKINVVHDPSVDQIKKLIKTDAKDKIYIVDTGGIDSDINRLILAYSDVIITPIEDAGLEMVGLQSFYEVIDNLNFIAKKDISCHVFLNKTHPSKKNFDGITKFVNKREYLKMLNTVIQQRIEITTSSGNCLAVSEYKRYSPAVRQYKQLIEEIKLIALEEKQ